MWCTEHDEGAPACVWRRKLLLTSAVLLQAARGLAVAELRPLKPRREGVRHCATGLRPLNVKAFESAPDSAAVSAAGHRRSTGLLSTS